MSIKIIPKINFCLFVIKKPGALHAPGFNQIDMQRLNIRCF